MAGEEKATLTQRRALNGGGASKLDRSKLRAIGEGEEEQGGSAAKVVIWVIIVVVLAVAAYLGLRTFLNNNENPDIEPTPTPTVTTTPDPSDLIVGSLVKEDIEAADLQANNKYSKKDQTVGEASEDAYTLDSVFIQPYETFSRVEFVVSTDGENDFPETRLAYNQEDNDLTISITNILTDESDLPRTQTAQVEDSVISSITHIEPEGSTENFVIDLNEDTKFVLHAYTEDGENKIAVDIKEPSERNVDNPDDDPDTTPTPTPTPTEDDTNVSSDPDVFSLGNKKLETATDSNVVRLTGYNYFDGSTVFTYNLKIGSDQFPNVSAIQEDNKIVFTIDNLATDNIVGNGGSGSTDFAAKGVRDINTANISNLNGTSVYEFVLDRPLQYRMFIDEEDKQLRIEFKH